MCSKSKLQQELDSIRSILRQNGFSEIIINSTISKKIARFYQPVKESPQKCPVYLKLPWIRNISLKFGKQVKSNVKNCFSAVEPRVIFHTRIILPSIHKDAVPTAQQSLVVYQHVCRCDCRYVGRTSLRLQERITQRIPKSTRNKEKPTKVLCRRNCKAKTPLNQLECNSAIGLHLLQNPDCAAQHHERQFSILAKAKTQFHLAVLEAIFIKTQQPILCR